MDPFLQTLFPGDGEMAALCRAHDWSSTPLGAPEEWSTTLRTLVRTLLSSRHPMLLLWGPALTQIYNDAYRPSLGREGRHPAALGASGRESGREGWEVVGPQIEAVLERGESTWQEDQLVPVERNGRFEEAYWTYGYTPVRDEEGTICGVLVITQETTARVRAEGESRRLAERLGTTLESITEAFYLLDGDWRITFVNSAGERLARKRRDELLGQVLWEVFPDVVGTEIEAVYRRAVATGAPQSLLYHYRPYDLWVDVRAYPSPEGLGAYLRDVTREQEAHRRVGEAEERFRAVARATTDAVWDLALPSKRLWWSEGMRESFGWDPEELTSDLDSWVDRLHPADRERATESLEGAIQGTGAHWEARYRFRRGDGSYAWVVDRGSILREVDGTAVRMVGGMSDETEVQVAQRRIREQANLLDRAQDAILVKELDHTIAYWNAGAERLYGWTREEAVGKSARELLYSESAAFDQATAATLEDGEWSGELHQRRKGGSELTSEARWSLVRSDEGVPRRILSIHTDVTERKVLLNQFLRAQRMESIGTLAGGIAHDLNNVLSPILLAIGLLREELPEGAVDETLSAIESSARRGADLVRQVLAFARGAGGTRVPVAAATVLEDLSRVVRDTFPRSITLELRVVPGLPSVLVDPTQLQQVLLNLLVNARDAMPEGGTLRVSAEEVEVEPGQPAMTGIPTPGPHLCISVADTGVGISMELLEQIFDPFFTTKEVGHGTGLGLSTVAGIVRSHGGFVTVRSTPGEGTTFHIYLPAHRAPEGRPPEQAAPDLPRGRGELVLVVDDEGSVRTITRQTLETFGYRVITAADGGEAVAAFRERREEIDLVLTDMTMPNMDGRAAIQAIFQANPGVKVVAASGGGGGREGAPAHLDPRVRHFLPKPYTAETLLTVLREVLDGANGEESE